MSWGDNGSARPSTEEYRNNFDKIFGAKKNDKSSEVSKRESEALEAEPESIGDERKVLDSGNESVR